MDLNIHYLLLENVFDQIVAKDTFQINKDFPRIPLFPFAEWKIDNANIFMVHANTKFSSGTNLHMSERNKQIVIDIGFALLTFTIFRKMFPFSFLFFPHQNKNPCSYWNSCQLWLVIIWSIQYFLLTVPNMSIIPISWFSDCQHPNRSNITVIYSLFHPLIASI